jgi:hypothetical protein
MMPSFRKRGDPLIHGNFFAGYVRDGPSCCEMERDDESMHDCQIDIEFTNRISQRRNNSAKTCICDSLLDRDDFGLGIILDA